MLELSFDISGRDLQGVADRLPEALQAGTEAVGAMMDKKVAMRIAQIYMRPIPTKAQVRMASRKRSPHRFGDMRVGRSGSKPAWKRTGQLRDNRKLLIGSYQARVAIYGKSRKSIQGWINGYAQRREQLGVSWTPKNPALNIIRRNEFFTEAAQLAEREVEPTFARAFERRLGLS